jgi:hypothetical protein
LDPDGPGRGRGEVCLPPGMRFFAVLDLLFAFSNVLLHILKHMGWQIICDIENGQNCQMWQDMQFVLLANLHGALQFCHRR